MKRSTNVLNAKTGAACFLFFIITISGCISSKYGEKVETENNWVNWIVQFKPGVHKDSVTASLSKIDQFFSAYINKGDPDHTKILGIAISHNVDFYNSGNPPIIQVIIGLVWSQGTRNLVNPPRPPRDELANFLQDVAEIRELR